MFHLFPLAAFHFTQRVRRAAAIRLRAAAEIVLRLLVARIPLDFPAGFPRPPKAAEGRIQPPHLSLHALSFLLQSPDYSSQVRHGSSSVERCTSASEIDGFADPIPVRLKLQAILNGHYVFLRRFDLWPVD